MRAPILTVLLGFATLSGCTFPGVYKLNVQQGNIVTADMLAQLESGMSQRQVSYVMGTPVIANPFNQQRWDYIYTLEQRDKIVKRYHISIFFDDSGNYSHYDGELPEDETLDKSQSEAPPAKEAAPNLLKTEE